MSSYKDYINLNLVDVAYNDLEMILGELEAERDEYIEKWAGESAEIVAAGTDPYTFFGERKLGKVNKKYAGDVAEIEMLMDDIAKELDKRDQHNEELKYSGKGDFAAYESAKEFLERESMKTEGYKKNK